MKHILLPESGERRLVFYLAMEEYLARENNDEEVFFIWQVAPTVICGRNQNIESEVNLEYCRKNNINVFRRKSGGGCVYADWGNLMLTWIARSEGVQQTFDGYLNRIAGLIRDTGAQACVSGRNDILIDGRKVSGNAFYQTPVKSIIHGTLLFHTDFNHLNHAITPSYSKTESKGVASVRQRVTNLCEHTDWSEECVKQHLIRNLCSSKRWLTSGEMADIEEIEATYLADEFLWGKNPPGNLYYEGRLDGVGEITVCFRMRTGRIESLTLEGDFFVLQDPIPILGRLLHGLPVREDAFRNALAGVDLKDYIYKLDTEEWIRLIFPEHSR